MPRILILAEGEFEHFSPGVGEFWFACTFFPLHFSFIFPFIVVAVVLARCVSGWLVLVALSDYQFTLCLAPLCRFVHGSITCGAVYA
jgi:hypothetical protein